MARLLYIEASPRKKRSASIQIAHAFVEKYKSSHPNDTVETVDLWQLSIPPFDGDVIDAKYSIISGQSQTEAQRKAWHDVEQIIGQFKQADKYLISTPMWNFGIPYRLKHYIDVLVQPTYTFSVTPEGQYKGLVENKPACLVLARGGAYGPGSGGETYDLQKSYLEAILGFIGFKDIRSILVEPTMAGPGSKEKALEKAQKQADELAAKF